jgi:hypothetical protein
MIDVFGSIVIGIVSSIISSLIWLYFFSMLRPKIEISAKIAKDINSADGKPVYIFKVINRSRRSIMNVRARLSLLKPFIVPEGQVNLATQIPLKTDDVFSLKHFDSADKNADYAFRFVTHEDLDSIWSNDEAQFIILRIYAMDSLSGLGKLFERKYMLRRDSIRKGTFVAGNSFEIK